MLKAEGLKSGYGRVEILHGVSFEVETGKITCIIGPNGSGKSTLMKTLVGLVKPTSGTILWMGENIAGLRTDQILKRGIQYVPQGRTIFRNMTVRENLLLGAWTIREKETIDSRLGEVCRKIPILIERIDQLAGTLSGGEQTLLCIGRALMLNPEILMLDEPSLGLAPKVLDSIYKKIIELCKSGMTIVVVEQNVRKALSVSEKVYVLDLGVNKFDGMAKEFLQDERLGNLYLGRK